MSKYVELVSVQKKIMRMTNDVRGADIAREIGKMPTVDVEEVKHGKWIYRGYHGMMGHTFECSVCGRWMFTLFPKHVLEEHPYCHCGAKMESVEGLGGKAE